MTAQEILNRVWKTFIIDKSPRSVDDRGDGCLYGNPDDGPGCAAACLLDDRDERLKLHQWEVVQKDCTGIAPALDAGAFPERFSEHESLINRLQNWHGDKETFGNAHRLNDIAKDFGLTPGVETTTS